MHNNGTEEECIVFYHHQYLGSEVSLQQSPEFGDYRCVPEKSTTLWNIILMKFWTLDEFLILTLEFQDYLVTSSLPQKLYQHHKNSGSDPFSILYI